MKPPFDIGDLVECVDDGPQFWGDEPVELAVGRQYRILAVHYSRWGGRRFNADGDFGVAIDGPMPAIYPALQKVLTGPQCWAAERFRLVEPASANV